MNEKKALRALADQLRAIPVGVAPKPGLASVAGWNRYDTDDEMVLHLWSGPDGQRSVSWDIRVPKVPIEKVPDQERGAGSGGIR